jgi:hypothetical protein
MKGKISTLSVSCRLTVTGRMLGSYGVAALAQWPSR